MAKPNLELVRREMAFMATHGQHAWRTIPGADIAFLVSLSAVQQQLAASAELEIDPDAELDAIVAAVKGAIDRLPQPSRDAAVEQFGFSDPDPDTARKKGAREIAAAKKLGTKQRMYEKPTALYGGLSRRDHIIGLVATGLCRPPESAPFNQSRDATLARPEQPTSWRSALGVRAAPIRGRAAAAILLILGFISGAWAVFDTGAEDTRVPPLGSMINASSGKLYSQHPVPMPPTASYGAVARGGIIRACDPTLTPCASTGVDPVVRPGDTLDIQLFLTNRFSRPVSWLKVGVKWEPSKNDLTILALWPGGRHGLSEERLDESVHLQLTDQRLHSLIYLPGSTALYTMSHEAAGKQLARLPDGILHGGIVLADLGPPGECVDCVASYARVISFQAHVESGY